MALMSGRIASAVAVLLLCGCTGTSAPAASSDTRPSSRTPAAGAAVPATATLVCDASIDGGPPPDGFEVVLGVVALPTSSAGRALQAFDGGDPAAPSSFAKTGLLVRAGQAFELDAPAQPGNRVALGWGNVSFEPAARFAVPACADTYGTGWLAYPGGYWADRPLCLPLTVRSARGDEVVHIGIGTPCPGQRPPANP